MVVFHLTNEEAIMARWPFFLAIILGWFVTHLAAPDAARCEVAPGQVNKAIRDGVHYLRGIQNADGSWSGVGATELVLFALLTAGESADDPALSKALNWSLQHDPRLEGHETYVFALQNMILNIIDPVRYRDPIARNANWFINTQIDPLHGDFKGPRPVDETGSWSYHSGMRPGDNSNTQYALLGLNAAAEAGIPVPTEVWGAAKRFLESCQQPDGGWAYQWYKGPTTASMTCAGISGLSIIGMRLRQNQEILVGNSIHNCGHTSANASLERGIGWLAQHFSVKDNFGGDGRWTSYYLYGLERAGRLSGLRFIGGHDWYREGIEEFIRTQHQGSGEWYIGLGPIYTTSFALLFLAKGRTPVLVQKLRHGPGNDWDNDPDDARYLVDFAAHDWKRPLTWHVTDPGETSVEDLLQAPIAFLNGHQAPVLDATARQRLRAYIDQGGFLLVEDCCGRPAFDQGARNLIKDLFPEPEHELRLLPDEHPIWRTRYPLNAGDHPLWGVESGCRTVLVYSPRDLSCYWGLAMEHPEHPSVIAAQRLGMNVIDYATGGEPPPDKLVAGEVARSKLGTPRRGALHIAKLRHAGDWNIAPLAIPNLMTALHRKQKMDVVISHRAILPQDPNLVNFPFLYIHGRGAMTLAPADLAPLRRHLDPGSGVIFADAACGSPTFDAAFRAFVAELLPRHKLEPIPADDPLCTLQTGYDLSDVQTTAAAGNRRGPPRLEGVKLDGHWSIIYSKLDIGCALQNEPGPHCQSYTHESALKIATNVVIYSTLP